MLRLRSSRFSQPSTGRRRHRRFPFEESPALSPIAELDHHLVHTLIPYAPLANSLEVFLDNTCHFFISFCRAGFEVIRALSPGPGFKRLVSTVLLSHSEQATLHVPVKHFCYTNTLVGFHLTEASTSIKPPRREGQRPHAIADRPEPPISQH